MKIIIDFIGNEMLWEKLKDYLLTQEGIKQVNIVKVGKLLEINVECDEKTTPAIVYKHIELFLSNPILVGFDKNNKMDCKKMKYKIDDMDCEYCYINFVVDMFNNENIKSLISNYELDRPAINVEFDIEFNKDIDEEEIKLLADKENE